MSNWNQVKNGGKGSGRRAGAQDDLYKQNYDNIFGKPCSECGVKRGHKTDCSLDWRNKQ